MTLEPPRLVGLDRVPRAAVSIRRAKSWAGIVGFGATFLAGYVHGASFESACLRALAGGLIAYLVAWAAVVAVWRRLVVAEARRAISRARGHDRTA